jgi:hypothetical protein
LVAVVVVQATPRLLEMVVLVVAVVEVAMALA